MSGILNTGVQVARGVSTTQIFLDSLDAPIMNVQHQAAAGQIALSAGTNPSQGFTISPVAQGNTQIWSGPNALISNTLSAPGQINLGVANVANALNVTGPTSLAGNVSITGNVVANGSVLISNSLQIGSTINVPAVVGNTISTSAFSATGQLANLYLETFTSNSSSTAALYLSSTWRLKITAQNGLAFQNKYNGNWQSVQVVQPIGFTGSISQLVSSVI